MNLTDAYDPVADCWWEQVYRARKQHPCSACGEVIRPRQRYHRITTIFEGSCDVIRQCARCYLVYRALQRAPWMHGDRFTLVQPDAALDCGHELEPGIAPGLDALALADAGELDAVFDDDALVIEALRDIDKTRATAWAVGRF